MFFMSKPLVLAAAQACFLFVVSAAQAQVVVHEPWVRAAVEQQRATGAFMRLSSGTDRALVQAASPVARHVEIHAMILEGDVMKMRQIPRLALPAGQAVELAPGGYHIMLIDLLSPVREGGHVPLTLTFESPDGKQETVEVEAPVRPLASGGAKPGEHGHAHAHDHPHASGHTGDASTAAAPEGVSVTGCWIRALPNRLPSAAYFRIDNRGARNAVLVGAQSARFGKVMLHANQTVDGMATMVHADQIVVPPGERFEFAPGGHHVMLEQPASELRVGDAVPLTFWFEGGRALTESCEIRPAASLK